MAAKSHRLSMPSFLTTVRYSGRARPDKWDSLPWFARGGKRFNEVAIYNPAGRRPAMAARASRLRGFDYDDRAPHAARRIVTVPIKQPAMNRP
jgi:hypothetical protein